VTVTRPDGKPAARADVGSFMASMDDPYKKDSVTGWRYADATRTGPNGSVTLKAEVIRSGQLVVRDAVAATVALVPLSPAKVAGGRMSAGWPRRSASPVR
jgi:hypothetical protein